MKAAWFWSPFLLLVLSLLVSCHRETSSATSYGFKGGGGSEVGNGGDPREILLQHGLNHATLLLERLDSGQYRAGSLPQVPEAHVTRFFKEREILSEKLRGANLVEVQELPKNCPKEKFACYLPGENLIYVSYRRAPSNLDYKLAAATFVHESVHMLGETDEVYANNAALIAMETWKQMNHPDGAHWFSMSDSPLTHQTVQEDPLLLKHQYVDWTGTHLAVWTEGFLQKYDVKTNRWELREIKNNEVQWQRGGGARRVIRDTTQSKWIQGYGVIFPPCYRSFPKLANGASGVRLQESPLEWLPMTGENAPLPRRDVSSVKSPDALFVWGGLECAEPARALADGGYYDPREDKWTLMAADLPNSPGARHGHGMIWKDDKLFVWGGFGLSKKEGQRGVAESLQDGGIYDVKSRSWEPIAVTADTPSPRTRPLLVWTGRELFAFGGFSDESGNSLVSGGVYDPSKKTWRALENPPAMFSYRILDPVFAFWTGSRVVLVSKKLVAQYDPTHRVWIENGRAVIPDYYIYSQMFWTGMEGVLWNVEDRVGHLFYP